MNSKGKKVQRIAHMTRHLPIKMRDVRQGNLKMAELEMLSQKLEAEKVFLKKCYEDICNYLHRENKIKEVEIPFLGTLEAAANFYYLEGLEVQDFMFIEEFYMYAEYKQQRLECLREKLNIGVGLLQACIYDLAYAIREIEVNMAYRP